MQSKLRHFCLARPCLADVIQEAINALRQRDLVGPPFPVQSPQAIDEFGELRFKPGTWDAWGIPERGCQARNAKLPLLLESGGRLSPDDAIHGLMDWLDVTDEPQPALDTLRQLLDRHYPADPRPTGRCQFVDEHGNEQVFHAGPVDLTRPLVAWQRRKWIIAVGEAAQEVGRLMIGARQPISLDVARRIASVSPLQYMGEPFDSFLGAQGSAGRTAAFYRWRAGEVTPTRWDEGLDDDALACFTEQSGSWLPPNQLAVQVAIASGY